MIPLTALAATIAVLAAPSINAQASADPCSAIRGGGNVLTAASVFACYSSFPVSSASMTAQIDTLLSLAEVYPYTNIAKSKIDIINELKRIQSDTTITSEFDLSTRISKAIIKLEDGHFTYSGTCYSVIQFFQPWVIAARYTAGSPKPTLYLRDVITAGSTISIDFKAVFPTLANTFSRQLLDTYTAVLGDNDPSLFIGYNIDAIDGMDPVTAVQQFADQYIGSSHTPETRFNFALAQTQYSKGLLQVKDGPFFTTGSSMADMAPVRNYTLRNPTTNEIFTVSAPWLGLFPASGSTPLTTNTYRRAFCGGSTGTIARASSSTFNGNPYSAIEYMAYLRGYKISEDVMATLRSAKKSVVKNAPPTALVSDDFDAFYFLPATKTGVFTMPGFLPSTPDGELTETLITSWLKTMATGLATLEQRGATNLLIDFTNNGGGIICSGKTLLSYIFKDSNFVQYDVRLTDTLNYLVSNADRYVNRTAPNPFILNGSVFPDGSKVSANALSTILSTARSYTRGGVTEKFSGRFDIDCESIKQIFDGFPQLNAGWNPGNVAVISNGFCGSTCAESVRSLRAQYGIKTYVYGGYNGKPFQPTTFEGGSVLDYDSVLDAFRKIPLFSNNQPTTPISSTFPMPARGQVLFWESYSTKTQDIPDEWIESPADEYVAVSDSTEIVDVWNAVAAKMPTTKLTPLTPKTSKAVTRNAWMGLCFSSLASAAVAALLALL
ncbi:hypothetical protein HDU67_002133 [Dinochytrium kinnereticum]|nr:hypothetical protein HDU67_002133 [Dinochytrium kinnereticum]